MYVKDKIGRDEGTRSQPDTCLILFGRRPCRLDLAARAQRLLGKISLPNEERPTTISMTSLDRESHRRLLTAILLALVILWGLVIRLDDLHDWRTRPDVSFLGQEPLITEGDGYHYLRFAQELLTGRYNPVDELRTIPDSPNRPWPPPLLSVLTAAIAKLTPFPLAWIAVVLPALLAVLLAIPLYGLGRLLGGRIMGLAAAALGLASNSFVARSSLGRYDTDCLIPFFTLMIPFCLLLFARSEKKTRYGYLGMAVLLFFLFLWWWDQAPFVVWALSFAPLAVALLIFYRPPAREAKLFFLAGIAFGGSLLVWQGLDLPERVMQTFKGYYQYIVSPPAGDFPAMAMVISEQKDLSASLIVARTTGNWWVFAMSAIGILLLIIKRPRESLLLIAPFSLAILSFAAERFMIFLAPVAALGFGFFIAELCKYLPISRLKYVVAPALLFYALWVSYQEGVSFASPFPPATIAGLDTVREMTPHGAVIWSWCDNGYPLMQRSGRATICDGQYHGGELSVYSALPLATDDPRLAANFMKFYIVHGSEGIRRFYATVGNDPAAGLMLLKRILAAGPERAVPILEEAKRPMAEKSPDEWLRFFFPPPSRPIYLFLDWGTMQVSHWIELLGTWDVQRQTGLIPLPSKLYTDVTVDGYTATNGKGTMQADLTRGQLVLRDNEIVPLSGALVRSGGEISRYDYGTRTVRIGDATGEYIFDIFQDAGFALLMGQASGERLFNRIFWLKAPVSPQYFRPVILRSPDYQLWEVGGDTIAAFSEVGD